MHVKKDDLVEVISGARHKERYPDDRRLIELGKKVGDKGKRAILTGKVLRVDKKNGRVFVEGVNRVTKHKKPTNTNTQGGIITIENSIDVSNVLPVCPKCKKGVRTGHKLDGDKKVRFCRKCGEVF